MSDRVCPVCEKPVEDDQSHIYHQRLKTYVHMDCPMDNVHGEDIRLHTVYFHFSTDQLGRQFDETEDE